MLGQLCSVEIQASVVRWSIGNEIDYRNDPFTHPILRNDYRPTNPPAQDLVARARPSLLLWRGLMLRVL